MLNLCETCSQFVLDLGLHGFGIHDNHNRHKTQKSCTGTREPGKNFNQWMIIQRDDNAHDQGDAEQHQEYTEHDPCE